MKRIKNFIQHFLKQFHSSQCKEPDIETLKQALIEFSTLDPDQLTPEQLEELLEHAKNH